MKLTINVGYASQAARIAGCAQTAQATEVDKAAGGSYQTEVACGDTAVSCWLPGGSRAVILSDGMGHGCVAAAESRAAAGLLRRLLKKGVPAAKAIKEVNRMLLERSKKEGQRNGQKEIFATVDLALIDPIKGKAQFYKLGASPTYIIRSGEVRRSSEIRCGSSEIRSCSEVRSCSESRRSSEIRSSSKIRRIQQQALPVGILPGIRLKRATAKIAAGDVIIMTSDGVADSGWQRGDGDWIKSFLGDFYRDEDGALRKDGIAYSSRALAQDLLCEAQRRCCDDDETDDATTVVIAIGENKRKTKDEE